MPTRATSLPGTSWPDRLRRACFARAAWGWRCAERSAQRRALAELDDNRLRDIGLTREQAQAEVSQAVLALMTLTGTPAAPCPGAGSLRFT